MSNPIVSATVNIQGGLLTGQIEFLPGLNFISGENGTLKTKLLQSLKGGAQVVLRHPGGQCRRQAISPKRNAERRAFLAGFTQLRREDAKLEGLLNERNINDNTFEKYPAVGDLFYVVYENLCRDGGDQIRHMREAEEIFNTVVSRIFPHYSLRASWAPDAGTPTIEIVKNGITHVPLEGLSLGEQEILSLALNIHSSRERFEVFLIDEPEVHLNWHLEDKLFAFFDDLCEKHSRQMIIVTHSRAIFKQRYYPKTQFLCWDAAGRVQVAKEVTPEQRQRIAGDAIEIIQLGTLDKPTFFVEDEHHSIIIQAVAKVLSVDVSTSETGNKANLRSLHDFASIGQRWDKCFFVEDGDGEGNPCPGDSSFIHLDKYCIETYLLDIPTAAEACGRNEDETRDALLAAILANRGKIFKRNKFFEFLVEHLRPEHLTVDTIAKLDASEIVDAFLAGTGLDFRNYTTKYIECANNNGTLSQVMPVQLVEALQNSRAAPTPPATAN